MKKNKQKYRLLIIFSLATILLFISLIILKNETFSLSPIPPKQAAPAFNTISVNIFSNETLPDRPIPLSNITQPVFPNLVCNVADYGAIGDGITKNTAAFDKAISDCAQKGGGEVLVPQGKWLTGPIHFQNNINLHIDKDAELVFSTDYNDYLPVVFSRFEGIEYYNFSPPIYAKDCTNIAITGQGTINGSGQESWWNLDIFKSVDKLFAMGADNTPVKDRVFGKPEDGLRPSFLQFVNCKNVLLEGVTLTNGPMWTIHPIYTSDMIIRHVTVNTSPGRSTDGIDIDSSKNILLEDSTFNTGDDSIVIKSGRDQDGMRVNKPSENIVIRGCTVNGGHAAFAIGSEISAGVRNVFVYNCNFQNTQFGLRLKGTLISGGTIENIFAQNISMNHVQFDPIQITTNYEMDLNKPPYTPTAFQNIFFKDIDASKSHGSVTFLGVDTTKISDVTLQNISMASSYGPDIQNASNINFIDTNFNTSKAGAEFTQSKNVVFKNYTCPAKLAKCLSFLGEQNEDIITTDSGISPRKISLEKIPTK